MRTSWDAGDAIFLGVKGGTPNESHAHMDIGSFVMEANGVRWAMDFGAQDYNSLESQGIDLWNMKQESQRWEVFRYNNMAHNTLTVNGKKQLISGNAPIENITEQSDRMSVSMDLTSLYDTELKSLKRGASIIAGRYVLIQDEYQAGDRPATIRWNMLTAAEPQVVDNHTIVLTSGNEKLTLRSDDALSVRARTWDTRSHNSFDASNEGTVFVGFEFELPANTQKRINVYLIPGDNASAGKPDVNLF